VIAIAAGVFVSQRSGRPTPAGDGTASTGTDKPSVAVLYFDNTSGDKELDWLRTGITEMVVTDLSQSPALEVVGTDRLYDILAELKRADDRVISPDVIREVAERTGVDNVIVGSYARSGDAIRINLRLQEASTGRIVTSERVEGPNASNLFAMIDDLSRRVRSKFEGLRAEVGNATNLLTAPANNPADTGLDRGLGDVTTSSIEAYRNYAEGVNLHERFREAEAATLFEKAIAVDPSFAMAYVKLAVVHGNLGHLDLRDKYATLALKHADRLTPRERFYIEGYFYTLRPATLGRGIDAYKKCIELDSGHQACRHNLALTLLILERTQEGIDHYEELVRRGSTNATAYGNLAGGYLALGDAEKALAVTQMYSKRNPENATGHRAMAQALVGLGRHEEALQEVTRALLLDPTDQNVLALRVVAQTLREDWAAAREAAATLYASPDATRKWSGALAHGRLAAFQGRSAEALTWAERAGSALRAPGPQTAGARQFAAGLLAARGQMPLALAQAQTALTEAKGSLAERAALSLAARFYAASKQMKEADEALAALAALADPLAPARDARVLAVARGQVALARGDFAAAIVELTKAHSALNPRTGNVLIPSQHVALWFALGEAYMGAGQPAQAEAWFRRVAESGAEHAFQPIEFVRSFYYLGKIHEQAGDMTKARDAYRRFVGYWKDGDLDRERIAEAERKLRGQT
jgi:TolB-like protein/predicted Zn-dependent protease